MLKRKKTPIEKAADFLVKIQTTGGMHGLTPLEAMQIPIILQDIQRKGYAYNIESDHLAEKMRKWGFSAKLDRYGSIWWYGLADADVDEAVAGHNAAMDKMIADKEKEAPGWR